MYGVRAGKSQNWYATNADQDLSKHGCVLTTAGEIAMCATNRYE